MFHRVIATLAFALAVPSVALPSDSTLTTEPQTVVLAAQIPSGGYHVGAGVIIRAQGALTIVTAAHVVKGAKAIFVQTNTHESLEVRDLRFIPDHDLALLRTSLPTGGLYVATPDDTVSNDAPLYVWGHPHSKTFVLSEARFLTERVTGGSAGLFAISCPTCAVGDSGGGVFDQRGHLLGIVSQDNPDVGAATGIVIAEPIGAALAAAGIAMKH